MHPGRSREEVDDSVQPPSWKHTFLSTCSQASSVPYRRSNGRLHDCRGTLRPTRSTQQQQLCRLQQHQCRSQEAGICNTCEYAGRIEACHWCSQEGVCSAYQLNDLPVYVVSCVLKAAAPRYNLFTAAGEESSTRFILWTGWYKWKRSEGSEVSLWRWPSNRL